MKIVNSAYPNQPPRLVFRESRKIVRIELHKILYCKGNRNYTLLCMADETKCICHSLGQFKKLLEPQGFISIHKSYLVNENCIETLITDRKPFVVLTNHLKLEVARRMKAAVARQLF